MQAPNELMNFAPNVVEINMDDQEAVWNSIQEKLHAVLNGKKNGYTFEELYRHVYIMCIHFKSGTLVYNGARRIIKEHIDKMVAKFEQIANYRDLQNQVVFEVNEFWYNFTNHVEFIRDGLLYLERYMSQNGGGEMEMTFDFGWRMFRTEILENQLIKQAMANRLVFNRENGIQANPSDDIPVDYKESPLFNVDTIIEIMTFLTTFKLGLQVSTAARQMAKLSDYVLTKRKPILRPIVIWHGIEGEMELEPFATKLHRKNAPNPEGKKMAKIFDDWYTNMAPKSRICLPETDSPEWLAGVELIYVMDGMNDKTFRFLNSLRDQLQNCQLILNISGFFPKLHQAGLSSQFFHLFNERCFSLVQDNLPCDLTKSFITKWPLWAIFNGIFFPNCRELTLSLDKLMMKVDEVEAPKWLMHSSTESQPRLLKLCADPENWFQFELVTMIQQIKAVEENLK